MKYMINKQGIQYCIFVCLFMVAQCAMARSAVTYNFSGGRLGDNLLAYCHAKWIACQRNIPLLYRPFAYSDQLMMHVQEIWLSEHHLASFSAVITLTPENMHTLDPDSNILYVVPYFSESIVERDNPMYPYLFAVNWDDPQFKNELIAMISPRNKLPKPNIGTDCVSIALHVRVGTGFDIAQLKDYSWLMTQKLVELKFPPFSFYIQALEKIISQYPNQKLYVYLFTDHNDPKELVALFEYALPNAPIIFDYKKEGNRHDQNVLEDFFALTHFDCLIRSDSNFSLVASKLSYFCMQISPWHIGMVNGTPIVDEICINNQIYACSLRVS